MNRKGIRRACLALEGATLDHPWDEDHDAYKIGGKMFAVMGSQGGLSFKTSDIAFAVLTETGKARPAPYLARAKWVHIDDPGEWSDDDLQSHLQTAYALVAAKLPKKVRLKLGLK